MEIRSWPRLDFLLQNHYQTVCLGQCLRPWTGYWFQYYYRPAEDRWVLLQKDFADLLRACHKGVGCIEEWPNPNLHLWETLGKGIEILIVDVDTVYCFLFLLVRLGFIGSLALFLDLNESLFQSCTLSVRVADGHLDCYPSPRSHQFQTMSGNFVSVTSFGAILMLFPWYNGLRSIQTWQKGFHHVVGLTPVEGKPPIDLTNGIIEGFPVDAFMKEIEVIEWQLLVFLNLIWVAFDVFCNVVIIHCVTL